MSLTVIAGGMFSEKTTEIQRRGKRLKRAGYSVLFVKPSFDDRYSEDDIVTHDGLSVPAKNVKGSDEIIHESVGYDAVMIDEVQFFEQEIIIVINHLLRRGKTVIVAGLDLDYSGEIFSITSTLMGYAEDVTKLKAVCSNCGTDSWVTSKNSDSEQRIELGSDDIYKPLCRKCHNDKEANKDD